MMKIYEEYAFCMQKKEEDMLAQEKMADGEKEELSQVCVFQFWLSPSIFKSFNFSVPNLLQSIWPLTYCHSNMQNEYKRGISGWNFNLDDMKAQASLV